MNRSYRVLVAATREGLPGLAPSDQGWVLLTSTIREFQELASQDDQQLGDIGGLRVRGPRWVALAYREI